MNLIHCAQCELIWCVISGFLQETESCKIRNYKRDKQDMGAINAILIAKVWQEKCAASP
jgi:hypothetical protein